MNSQKQIEYILKDLKIDYETEFDTPTAEAGGFSCRLSIVAALTASIFQGS